MIIVAVGTLGAGKTYCMIVRMIDALVSGVCVWTNIDLQTSEIDKLVGSGVIDWERQYYHLAPEDLATACRNIPRGTEANPTWLVIDEASEWLDSYFDQKSAQLQELLSWFRMSRHMGVDVYLITQDESLIQKRVRILAQKIIVHHDGKKFKIPNIGCGLPPPWRFMFLQVDYDKTKRFRLSPLHWISRDKKVFACYKTTELYRDYGVGFALQKRRIKAMTKNQVKMLFISTVAGLIGLVLGVVALYRHAQYIKHVPASVRAGLDVGGYDARNPTNHSAILGPQKKLVLHPCEYSFVTAELGGREETILRIDGRRVYLGDWLQGFRIVSFDRTQAFGIGPDGLAIFHPRGSTNYEELAKKQN